MVIEIHDSLQYKGSSILLVPESEDCWLVACLTSQQYGSVSQGWIARTVVHTTTLTD